MFIFTWIGIIFVCVIACLLLYYSVHALLVWMLKDDFNGYAQSYFTIDSQIHGVYAAVGILLAERAAKRRKK